ncbi:hypothetical protein ACGF07_11605 [Kitasatospora sp. NPDC048194]|uniref:hypothetical protein n=1 Tax=Kitasatospora sp. NPDC048194 TaxID=3364045 RepID=UPI0037185ACB
MAAREDTARDVRHEPGRHGRHGRPRPFGGRFRLPTLRFSGAAMAMSTVVGISIATTLLLNEQQGIGRRAGVARVGTTPPPTPGTTDQAEAAAERTPASPAPSDRAPGTRPTGRPSAHPSAPANAAATGTSAKPPAGASARVEPSTGGQASADGQASAGREPRSSADVPAANTGAGADTPAGPSPSAQPPTAPYGPAGGAPADGGQAGGAQTGGAPAGGAQVGTAQAPHLPGLRPVTPGPSAQPAPGSPLPPPSALVPGDLGGVGAALGGAHDGTSPGPGATPTGGAPAPGATPAPGSTPTGSTPAPADPTDTEADQALTGTGRVTPLGRDGLRHALELSVTERVTALQAELRLAPGELSPGSGTAWTDLPGAVVTVQQERGTLVYRFTTPPGTDVQPGRYGFAVHGARPAGPVGQVRTSAPPQGWNAAAFGIDHPRAVAALGGFGPLLPQPAQPPAHAPR